jgi:flagellar biogenesis protein FliO
MASAPAPASGKPAESRPAESPTISTLAELAGLGWMILRMVVALVIVCAVAYFTLRLLAPRLKGHVAGALIKVHESRRIDPKTTIHLLEVGNRFALVGVGEGGIQALSPVELDAEAIRAALAEKAEIQGLSAVLPPGPAKGVRSFASFMAGKTGNVEKKEARP